MKTLIYLSKKYRLNINTEPSPILKANGKLHYKKKIDVPPTNFIDIQSHTFKQQPKYVYKQARLADYSE